MELKKQQLHTGSVLMTLQYCLETFEQACQCGECDPCTNGQDDIKAAIETVQTMNEKINQVEDIIVNHYAEEDEPFSESDLRTILNQICCVLDSTGQKITTHH